MKRPAQKENTHPWWWNEDALDPSIAPKAREALLQFLQQEGLVVTKRDPAVCSCDFFEPTLVPGYQGVPKLGCKQCTPRCGRCGELSTAVDYASTRVPGQQVCFGCASGDHDEKEASPSPPSREEETPYNTVLRLESRLAGGATLTRDDLIDWIHALDVVLETKHFELPRDEEYLQEAVTRVNADRTSDFLYK